MRSPAPRPTLKGTAVAVAILLPTATGAMAQDIVRVDLTEPGRWGDTLHAVEELVIGSISGRPAYTFGMLTGLAVDDSGRIYASDYQVPAVYRYAPDGRVLGKIGRRGEGPGEYEQPLDLVVMDDGSLALLDFGNRRINRYGPKGEVRDAIRVPTSSLVAGRMLFPDTAGRLYVRTLIRSGDEAPHQGLIQLGSDGTVEDTLHMPERASDGAYRYRRETLWTWSPQRRLVSGDNRIRRGTVYRLVIQDTDGSSVTVLRSMLPVALAGEERREWEAHAAWRERRERRRGRDVDFPDLPDTKPAFKDLGIDEEGRIWVHRYVEAEKRREGGERVASGEPVLAWRERPTFDVFAPDGSFLGTAVLPHRTRRWVSRGRTVWAVKTGSLGESYIVRYRLVAR